MKTMLDYIIERYGPRLTTADLALVMKKTPDAIRTEIAAGKFPIQTYKDTNGERAPRYADARDVAEYLDRKRPRSEQHNEGRGLNA